MVKYKDLGTLSQMFVQYCTAKGVVDVRVTRCIMSSFKNRFFDSIIGWGGFTVWN